MICFFVNVLERNTFPSYSFTKEFPERDDLIRKLLFPFLVGEGFPTVNKRVENCIANANDNMVPPMLNRSNVTELGAALRLQCD